MTTIRSKGPPRPQRPQHSPRTLRKPARHAGPPRRKPRVRPPPARHSIEAEVWVWGRPQSPIRRPGRGERELEPPDTDTRDKYTWSGVLVAPPQPSRGRKTLTCDNPSPSLSNQRPMWYILLAITAHAPTRHEIQTVVQHGACLICVAPTL